MTIEYCTINPEVLSDNYVVWNLHVVDDPALPEVIFKCEDEDHATALKEQIEKCIDINICTL